MDYLDLKSKVGNTQFIWAQALWHPKWEVHVVPSLEKRKNIELVAEKLDQIQKYFKRPIIITSWLRAQVYNELIGGATKSQHTLGCAVDFYIDGLSCDEVRTALQPKLEEMKIRCEDKKNASWVHIDLGTPVFGRFFKP